MRQATSSLYFMNIEENITIMLQCTQQVEPYCYTDLYVVCCQLDDGGHVLITQHAITIRITRPAMIEHNTVDAVHCAGTSSVNAHQ